jgi:hypothetical protein
MFEDPPWDDRAPFTPEQVKALFAQVRDDGDPDGLVYKLANKPRAFVADHFRLTDKQQRAMSSISDDDLKERVAGIVKALGGDDGSDLQIVNGDRLDDEVAMEEDRGVAILVCSCIFVAYMSKRAVAF